MAGPRFTLAYGVLVAAWLAQAAFALGLVVPREPSWPEIAALLAVMAVAPVAPDAVVPYLIAVPIIGLVIAVATEPALWR
ncbi:hypothetical protein AAFN86_17215 [Roseomonas sp. CAU 1739]